MGLNALDFVVIVVYLLGVTLFGLRFRRHNRRLNDYFLADKTIPWWAISLSIVAAETSTLTIISVPGLAYEKDFRFLQLVFGYIVGRAIVTSLLVPRYFRGELLTAYQLIDRHFGERLRSLTAALFLITRAAAEGVRVFAVAICRDKNQSFLHGDSTGQCLHRRGASVELDKDDHRRYRCPKCGAFNNGRTELRTAFESSSVAALEGLAPRSDPWRPPKIAKRWTMSLPARRRIGAAKKAWWAKQKPEKAARK